VKESDGINLILHSSTTTRNRIEKDDWEMIYIKLNDFLESSRARTRDAFLRSGGGALIIAADDHSVALIRTWADTLNVNGKRFKIWTRDESPFFTVRPQIPPRLNQDAMEVMRNTARRADLDLDGMVGDTEESSRPGRNGTKLRELTMRCSPILLAQIRAWEAKYPDDSRPFPAFHCSMEIRYGQAAAIKFLQAANITDPKTANDPAMETDAETNGQEAANTGEK
jgi:hypothetical protein